MLTHFKLYIIAILLVVDLCSSLASFMMTQPLPIASKLPIKTLIARQLPINAHIPSSMRGTMYVLTSADTVNTDKSYGIIDYCNNYYELLLL